ncbi:methionine adenosyltransferase [Candidatus Marinamargulisbacteria bacterium SCGC AG-414-C22]|nr:methionine adenosyltransferase [Candidatus Marinamargulisbacteria bacterium SCGC AG-414-C22]
MTFIFTSESVGEGHPDKVCDQISDAVLDAALAQDPTSRVAIETFTTTGIVIVGGEMTTNATLDVQDIVRKTLKRIGYVDSTYGIHSEYCSVMIAIHEQSADIAQGVNEGEGLYDEMGAGDQGLMFGYACKQTPEYMPLPIQLSHQIMQELSARRKKNVYDYLRPDAKAQVSVQYTDRNTPERIDTVVLSTQHHPEVDYDLLKNDMIALIKSILPENLVDNDTRFLINPTGRFVIGGPHGDAGLTGRKIIVDTYGGWVPHGGGAFSGKDSTKVDRSAAYMARYVAKNMVAAGFAEELEIQLAYAIGFPEPVSINVNTFESSSYSAEQLIKIIRENFDLTPAGIIKTLKLREPIFGQTAAYGHFGRTDIELPWESLSKVESLKVTA